MQVFSWLGFSSVYRFVIEFDLELTELETRPSEPHEYMFYGKDLEITKYSRNGTEHILRYTELKDAWNEVRLLLRV